MAIRTTTDNVQGILGKNYDPTVLVDPFIESATVIVDRVVTCASSKGIPLTTTEAELVERWVAAHMYAAADPLYTSRSTNKASGSFQGQFGMRLESTDYGQRALSIDPSGCLAAISKGARIGFGWGGKTEPEQLTYRERN